MNLLIGLGNSNDAEISIKLNNNPFVHKWVNELQWCVDNCQINQDEAFAGFLTAEQAGEKLLQACLTINKYVKGFVDIQSDVLDQSYLNYLHLKFETLSGSYGKPTRLFAIANDELKQAIRALNFYVHCIEDKTNARSGLYLSFDKNQYRRQSLEPSDYQYFEFEFEPGTLVVSYVELGKELCDLYEDSLPLDYANLKNLHYYSGESWLIFDRYAPLENKGYVDFLINSGFDPYDKTLGHGKIPIGTLVDFERGLELIKSNQFIHTIKIQN